MLYKKQKNAFYLKNILILVLSCISILLTSWFIIPAPKFPLLIFAIIAPVISPWLLLFNIITLI